MKFEKKHTCHMTVLRRADGDCSNHGLSSRVNRIRVAVFRNSEGRLPNYSEVKEVAKSVPGGEFIACQYSDMSPIVCTHAGQAHRWTMAGGNYASTTNGIDHDALGCHYPISIHDRVE